MSGEIVVRQAALGDGRRLHAACFAERDQARFLDFFERGLARGCWLLAEDDGRPAGCAQLDLLPWRAEIANLVVVPGARRRGIGRLLVQTLLAEAARCGATRVELLVAADNRPAIELYLSLGFARERRLRLPAADGGRTPALLLVHRLAPSAVPTAHE